MTKKYINTDQETEQLGKQNNHKKAIDQNLWINWTIVTNQKTGIKNSEDIINKINIRLNRYFAKNGVKSNQKFKITVSKHKAKRPENTGTTGSPIKSTPPPPPPI